MIVSAVALLSAAVFFLVDTIPPRSLTGTRMFVTMRRILQFAHGHNKLPPTLAELPPMPGYDTETTDAWGRPLDYSVDDAGVVILRSLGADGHPGGDGENEDMTASFTSRDSQGRWESFLSAKKDFPAL